LPSRSLQEDKTTFCHLKFDEIKIKEEKGRIEMMALHKFKTTLGPTHQIYFVVATTKLAKYNSTLQQVLNRNYRTNGSKIQDYFLCFPKRN